MRRGHIASEKLQKQINDFNAQPIVAGDKVLVKGEYLKCSRSSNKEMLEVCTVKEVTEDGIVVFNGYHMGDTCLVAKVTEVVHHSLQKKRMICIIISFH